MIMKKQLFGLGAILVILFAGAGIDVSAKTQRKLKQVKVYLYHSPGEHIDLSPVTRSVNAVAPARGAIEALLAGPTAAEKEKGFGELAGASEFRIGLLKISRGTARINFVSKRTWKGWPGDLAPVRFKTAVELTLKQFPTVKRVIVSLDGDAKFWDES
jgi:Sporulation and spore germination